MERGTDIFGKLTASCCKTISTPMGLSIADLCRK